MKKKIQDTQTIQPKQYHIRYEYDNSSSYIDAYPIGMENLKLQVEELLDAIDDITDNDISIYELTNLKVKSERITTITEE